MSWPTGSRDTPTRHEAARLLFEWVRDEIRYDMAPDVEAREDWSATATLERGQGLLPAEGRACSRRSCARATSPPAIVLQDLLDHKIPPHYVELHRLTAPRAARPHLRLPRRPLGAARSDAPPRLRREASATGSSSSTATNDAVLAETDLDGQPHFEVLEELGTWPDLPDEIVEQVLGLEWLHSDEYKRVARRKGPGM